MALGGGTWQSQNKALPGAYINFTSAAKASAALSDRGIAAVPLALDWGAEGAVLEVTLSDLLKNSKQLFGYDYTAPEMLPFRELFKHATKLLVYRLGTGAMKAACTYATAKFGGMRGNAIRIVIAQNVDDAEAWDVSTFFNDARVDMQTVASAGDLVANEFVTWISTAELAATAGMNLTGGANATITGASHQAFLDAIEAYSYNTLCCPVADSTTVALYTAFTRRVREELGAKFQLVAWHADADYEGVIGVWNAATNDSNPNIDSHALVYWMTGAQAGVAVNKSLTNAIYDGELNIDTAYTQAQLEAAIKSGKLMLHNVNGRVRVLEDVNTLITVSADKGEVFKSNQTMRVCDQVANDVAVLFGERYVGTVPNDESGRASLWGDVVQFIQQLERIRAVENFDPDTVNVELGDNKRSVVLTVAGLNIINAMSQLYMSVVIE